MNLLETFFEWDVPNWSRSMRVWEKHIPVQPSKCLEIGARRGGLSLMLALRGHHAVCSDLNSPEKTALPLHSQFQVPGSIEYKAVDLKNIKFEEEFDVIIFKSVLGGVARNDDVTSAKEIAHGLYGALKAGGVILLAENNAGTFVHRFFRKTLRRWGKSWSYFSLKQLKDIFSEFEFVEVETFGLIAPFTRGNIFRKIGYAFDLALDQYLPTTSKYITVAVLKKKQHGRLLESIKK